MDRSGESGNVYAALRFAVLEAWQWSQIHGNANSWTGQTGVASVFIRELLRERLRLLDMIAEMAADDEALRDEEFGPQAEVVK